MNKQTNTPELRFPEFDEEWEKRKLGEVVNYKNGGSFESLVKNHGVYKLITLKSVNTEGKLCNSGKYIDDKCVETLCNDTLVMILSEQAPGLVGMTAIIPNNNEYVLNQRVAALVPKQFIDSQFLSKLINRNQKYFSVRSAGTKVKNISKGHVENFNFLSPDYTEQQKIGNFFSKLDRQIELEEKKLELFEQQKKGYMQKIFSQQLRFKDENGNDYPKWENKLLGNLVNITMGQSPSSKNYTENSNYTTLVQGNADLNNGYIQPRIYTKQITKLAEVNDILLTVRAPVGKIGRAQLKACIGRGVCAIKGDSFIYYFLELFDLQNKWIRFSQGSTFESISGNEIKNIDIAYPINEERQKISEFLSKLDELLKNQLLKVEQLKQRKKGLLQKMFV
ncbi:restriction endonuclease subunit S [Staphylococcus hominis]|uniref:restriction endonuclease subunit S n=1 Tax=Staphylococcus hominis TaxID=1290 RepID=UPI0028792D41|nr:restriction endonuclease subunit S [Staphylococcus hominis]MDS3904299.1 restriction endonuclease subunit S [Staphylococcus hominis]